MLRHSWKQFGDVVVVTVEQDVSMYSVSELEAELDQLVDAVGIDAWYEFRDLDGFEI